MEERQEFSDVSISASALWSRRGWIVLAGLLGALAALAFVLVSPATHRSWSQVLVRPLGVDLSRGPVNIDRTIDTVAERELAGSFIVAERTADRLDGDVNPRNLRQQIEIETIEGSPVLEFSYSDERAEAARDVTQAFATSYLEIRGELAAESVADARSVLEQRRADLISERQQLVADRAQLDDDDERVANLSAETVVANQLAGLADDIARLGALTSDPGDIISPAQLAERSERPRLIPTVLAGAILAGLLGVLAALWFDRGARDDDLTDDDLADLGLAPVAHLPRESRGADAFASLERRLAQLMGEDQVVAFTTVDDDSVTTQIASWFAWNLAESGSRVLLISADFTDHAIAHQFGLDKGPGLTDALVAGSDPDPVTRKVGNLYVVTAGGHPGDPTGVLQMVGMSRLLNRARRVYDRIVIHAPDVAGHEPSLLASWAADAATVVVDEHTQRHQIERVAAVIARTDARAAGAVVIAPALHPATR